MGRLPASPPRESLEGHAQPYARDQKREKKLNLPKQPIPVHDNSTALCRMTWKKAPCEKTFWKSPNLVMTVQRLFHFSW